MTWRDAARSIAAAHEVTLAQLLSQQRHPPVVRARFLLYWHMREKRCLTFPQIARLLDRDQSSINHGYRVARSWIRDDPSLAALPTPTQEAAE